MSLQSSREFDYWGGPLIILPELYVAYFPVERGILIGVIDAAVLKRVGTTGHNNVLVGMNVNRHDSFLFSMPIYFGHLQSHF